MKHCGFEATAKAVLGILSTKERAHMCPLASSLLPALEHYREGAM